MLHTYGPGQVGLNGEARKHRHPADPSFGGGPEEFEHELDPGRTVALVAVSCKATRLRCRLLSHMEVELILHCQHHEFVPSEILTVCVSKVSRRHQSMALTGRVVQTRVDLPALGLEPLTLCPLAPEGSAGEAALAFCSPVAQSILANAVSKAFEGHLRSLSPPRPGAAAKMARVAQYPLHDLLTQDLRCLDAYAYLGEFALDHKRPEHAQRYFDAGASIGLMSTEPFGDCRVPWRVRGNVGFLRCLRGQALTAEALENPHAKSAALEHLSRFDPSLLSLWRDLFG